MESKRSMIRLSCLCSFIKWRSVIGTIAPLNRWTEHSFSALSHTISSLYYHYYHHQYQHYYQYYYSCQAFTASTSLDLQSESNKKYANIMAASSKLPSDEAYS